MATRRYLGGHFIFLSVVMIKGWLITIYKGLTLPQKAAILSGLWVGELAHVLPDRLATGVKRIRKPKAGRRWRRE